MDRGYTPKQFISLFDACNNVDQQVERLLTTEFGAQMSRGGWGRCCRNCLYKGRYFTVSNYSYSNMTGGREGLIDYEFLRGRQNETVVKELCVISAEASETLRFKSPYKMADHGSSDNGLNWADGHIEYKKLHTVITETVVGFAHLYAYGVSKCTLLAGLTGRPIHNLEDLECPTRLFQSRRLVYIAVSQVSQILLRN